MKERAGATLVDRRGLWMPENKVKDGMEDEPRRPTEPGLLSSVSVPSHSAGSGYPTDVKVRVHLATPHFPTLSGLESTAQVA